MPMLILFRTAMTSYYRSLTWVLLLGLSASGCQSSTSGTDVSADLNSNNPAVAAQAQKVQQLLGQLKQQQAVIEAEKTKLKALQLQLEGAQQNLEGLRKEAQVNP